MPMSNIRTNQGTIERRGYTSAVDSFCDKAHGQEVAGQLYLSMATRVWVNQGGEPEVSGTNGYVYFEIHNKRDEPHVVDGKKCREYLMSLGRKCNYRNHGNTKGGTWQVGKIWQKGISYHAVPDKIVSPEDCLDKTVIHSVAIAPLEHRGKRNNTLERFPTYAFNDVTPFACHSHNDYEGHDRIALYSALQAGCISVEADIWIDRGDKLMVKHIDTDAAIRGTIQDLYLAPLKALIDARGAVFPAHPTLSFNLLVDFKEKDGDKTFNLLVQALTPLREAGYLSHVDDDGKFKKGLVTIIASGDRPWRKIINPRDNPLRAIFADGYLDESLVPYNAANTHYVSAEFRRFQGRDILPLSWLSKLRVNAAHQKGLKVRLYAGPKKPSEWQELIEDGVDRINVDNLADVAAVKWNPDLL